MSEKEYGPLGRIAWAVMVLVAVSVVPSPWTEMPLAAQWLTPAPIAAPAAITQAASPAARMSPATATLVAPPPPAALRPPLAMSDADRAQVACSAPSRLARLDRPLLRTGRQLASGAPLKIVAVGSSSTGGAGASSPDATYPSRLAIELRRLFPGRDITVLNRGVNGEETNDMMARFATGVIAEHPQLVLWQVGTNSVLRDHPLGPHLGELREGIEELKQTGADVVLIDPQYAPKVLAKSETPGMVDQIAFVAREENVGLFHRFAIMRDWSEAQHHGFDLFVSPDGLHMNDWGYACWAKLLAASIANAANPPVASAAAPTAR